MHKEGCWEKLVFANLVHLGSPLCVVHFMNNLHIEDDSSDKKYFTMVPNYILNHSSAIDQALYLQMKRFAGENGVCSASKKTLRKQLGIGKTNLEKSLAYLVDHKWISFNGEYGVMTPGGIQMVARYKVNDIWRMNIEYYSKGGSETAHLNTKGGLKTPKGGPERSKGGSETATTKNNTNNIRKEDFFKEIRKKHKLI